MKIEVEIVSYPGRIYETVEITEDDIRELAKTKFLDKNYCNRCEADNIIFTTKGE